ncbi:MAG: hypothetical protein ABT01_00535 [Clostridium sp. SCN 57-10]|nr:MAG: hypothetical protein ABT01_00535 [Clostridium sp. SCN 57-10]
MEEGNPLLSIETQMLALFGIIVASILGIMTLQGLKEQQSGVCPGKDYGFIDTLPKISTTILLATAVYFVYLAYQNHMARPDNPRLTWLMIASIAGLFGSVIRADIAYLSVMPTAARLEEEVE